MTHETDRTPCKDTPEAEAPANPPAESAPPSVDATGGKRELTKEEKLERFAALVAKTGRVYVATDVLELIKDSFWNVGDGLFDVAGQYVDVHHDSYLPAGMMMAYDPGRWL